ncbi:MAG: helix-turn-helix transcriptional regulator [Vampirovibrionales bacterium]|nr:helix-turn-helix transcriptional regulator [Vampirovibrionales bacterium]
MNFYSSPDADAVSPASQLLANPLNTVAGASAAVGVTPSRRVKSPEKRRQANPVAIHQQRVSPCLMRLRVAEAAAHYRRWTMKELAEALDVDHQTVMYWNQGRAYPRVPMLVRLAGLIGCSVADLFHYDGCCQP